MSYGYEGFDGFETTGDALEWHHQQRIEADIEIFEMQQAAAEAAALRAQGICDHPSGVGYLKVPVYPEQQGLKKGQMYCYECKQVVPDPYLDLRQSW